MRELLTRLLIALGLIYDKSSVMPDLLQGAERKPRVKRAGQAEDGVSFAGGKAWKEVRTFEWEVVSKKAKRGNSMLTPAEVEEIKQAGLHLSKAAELKPFFVRGLSAAQASGEFIGLRGYGKRTIEKYWAIFNRHSSPDRGSGRKSAAKDEKAA